MTINTPDQNPNVETIQPDSSIVGVTPEAPVTATWYTWKTINGLNVYDTVIVQDPSKAQPANSTKWKPPVAGDSGLTVYWDGIGWRMALDVTKASLSTLQDIAQRRADLDFTWAVNLLSSGYTPAEQASWKQQVLDAEAVITGGESSALLLALATARSMDVKDLAASIVAKSNAYNTKYATLLATYQKLRDSIGAAKTVADLPAVMLDDLH